MACLALSSPRWIVPLQLIPFVCMICALSVAETNCRIAGVGVYYAAASMIMVLGAVNADLIDCEQL
jgi:hypothetical protein